MSINEYIVYTQVGGYATTFHGITASQFDIPNRNNYYGSNPCRNCPNFDPDPDVERNCILGGGENCEYNLGKEE